MNIVEQYRLLKDTTPPVIGGSTSPNRPHNSDDFHILKGDRRRLLEGGAIFYTGHCTGEASYQILKEYMQEHLEYLPTGRVLEFP